MAFSSRQADAFVEIWKSKTGKDTFPYLGNHDLGAWNEKSVALLLYGEEFADAQSSLKQRLLILIPGFSISDQKESIAKPGC